MLLVRQILLAICVLAGIGRMLDLLIKLHPRIIHSLKFVIVL
ncbi:MAG: hypothetical protein AVDCRST_MAG74-254 [uncultured Pyrinomonadaceae bacterium]|uniref:Uncharacterized protein n=1 Tax=uncultured Pyrinomonadaceae bacterium TaxID=2283094 RepID=A0A6J4NAQ8_9BACT|nr:MAG: hypothetical protein AVDCRST_MAG74-254 [uncultured Pyrinomonadaceae bacterium]